MPNDTEAAVLCARLEAIIKDAKVQATTTRRRV
jgi:hypothetical protein